MHDATDFRGLYDTIWVELEREVRDQKVGLSVMNSKSYEREIFGSRPSAAAGSNIAVE